jgi:tape measure domain-containing protein
MPSSVENRVVQMTFDNAKFEQKLDQTMKSIVELEKSLQFEKSKKSLQDFSTVANNFNLGNISAHIEGVSKKFLVLGTIAATTLSNITSAAIHAGTNIVKSLSLDTVLDGFHEYETNINSIQTIMANTASKGSSLKDVNDALDELNTFSDKTIYNFSQMTKNIGTFTAAGVDLKTSVQSIKGIANLAAISGSNADQASTAMYQLSQAIASGTVKLQDWNSVVNAGMGGEVFQKALFETGKALKTIKDVPMTQTFDQWKKAGNSFRGSLEQGWITSEVLTTTLQNFTGEMTAAQVKAKGFTSEQATEIERLGKLGVDSATKVRTMTQLISTVKEAVGSGWSASFRTIFGDFEEATQVFTDVSNAIGSLVSHSAKARNELLTNWKNMGGRLLLIKGVQQTFKSLSQILLPIQRAFREVFPKTTAKQLLDITRQFVRLAEALAPSAKTADNIKRTFKGLFQLFKIGIEIAKGVVSVVKALGKSFERNTDILGTTARFGDFLNKLRLILVEGGKIKNFFKAITNFIQDPQPALKRLQTLFFDTFGKLEDIIKKPVPLLIELKDKILSFLAEFLHIPGLVDTTFTPFENVLGRVKTRFEEVKKVAEFFIGLWQEVFQRLMGVKQAIQPVLENVLDYIKTWFKELGQKLAAGMSPGDFSPVLDAVNVGLLGGLLLVFKKFVDKGLKFDFGGGFMANLSGLVGRISGSFNELTNTLKTMQTVLKANALLQIAIAIAILSASLLTLSLIDSKALSKALAAVSAGFAELVAVMVALNKLSNTGFSLDATATAMILIASAMLILSAAVSVFSRLSLDEIGRGLTGLAGGLLIMVTAVKLMGKASPTTVLAAAAMILMAIAIDILATAMLLMAKLSWEDIGKGMTVIVGALTAIGVALTFIPPTAPLVAVGVALVAVSLVALAGALKVMSLLKWNEIARGSVAIAAGLVAVGVGMHSMPPSLPFTAKGLILVGAALVGLAGIIKLFALFSWGEFALAIGLTAMIGTLPGAIALAAVAGSLTLMLGVIKAFDMVKWQDLAKGLGGIVAVIATLAAAALLSAPAIPLMIALAAALVLVGAAFGLFGLGALATANAIAILATTGKAGIDVIFAFMDGLLERFPKLAVAMGTSILKMGQELLEGADPLLKALGILLVHILDKLTELLPSLFAFVGRLLDNVAQLIIDKSPKFIEAGFNLLLNILQGIKRNIGQLTKLAVDIITGFLQGLKSRVGDITNAGFDLLIAFMQGIEDNMEKLVSKGVDVVLKWIKGVASQTSKIVRAGGDIIINVIKGFGRNTNAIVRAGTDVLINFLKGLSENSRRVINAVGQFILDLLIDIGDAIDQYLPQIEKAGRRIAGELINGMTLGVLDHAPGFIKKLLGIDKKTEEELRKQQESNSPSKVYMRIGQDMMLGLTKGISDDTSYVRGIVSVSQTAADAFNEALAGISDEVNKFPEFNPTITPVLDLTSVQKDSKQISSFFKAPDLEPVVTQAKDISAMNLQLASSQADIAAPPATAEVKFEQNNYSPKALSTADIYKQTRNQIAMAKEGLKIP